MVCAVPSSCTRIPTVIRRSAIFGRLAGTCRAGTAGCARYVRREGGRLHLPVTPKQTAEALIRICCNADFRVKHVGYQFYAQSLSVGDLVRLYQSMQHKKETAAHATIH